MQTNIDPVRDGCAIDAIDGAAAIARKCRRLNGSIELRILQADSCHAGKLREALLVERIH